MRKDKRGSDEAGGGDVGPSRPCNRRRETGNSARGSYADDVGHARRKARTAGTLATAVAGTLLAAAGIAVTLRTPRKRSA
jgi:hypothetical protein